MMVESIACSEMCPYDINYIDKLSMSEVVRLKERTDYREALKTSVQMDNDMKNKG